MLFFFSFWTPFTFKFHNFLIFYSFKCYRNTTWSSTNHLRLLIATKQHIRNFLGVHGSTFVVLGGLFFFGVLDLVTFGGCNFLIFNLFLTIVSMLDVPRRGVQVLFGHHKQWSSPLGSGLSWVLTCSTITGWSTL